MAFRLAGFKNSRNYDASYHAWCADPDTEIVQGPNPGAVTATAEDTAASDDVESADVEEGQAPGAN
jgi:hypothetical protein